MVFDNGRDAKVVFDFHQDYVLHLGVIQLLGGARIVSRVLAVAQRNGNQLFIANIEREIAALGGEHSPLING